ncbi:ABC transporter permease [Streptococcus sciuri]|uniref:ABC transporter permease n=1 Tax=Streptococcus sciuri TaxID=2973939 RepID=A0ABT2F581_9STRE|nr:FtsX-like permease family protein [Streptococcus sciuri]MCS4487589.1 ABC transporter permease [Streptococcus sciuri]
MFYFKMAWNNLKNSFSSYVPFMLTSFFLYLVTCSTFLILLSPMGKSMGAAATSIGLGAIVLSIFSLIMERYSYRVLLKQRSREFGLYNILGMNKRQVGMVATFELMIIFAILVILGTLFSGIFAKFTYVIFVNLTNYHLLNLKLVALPFLVNALIFAGIFLILWLSALAHIKLSSPLNLFRSQQQGEKEPRGNVLLALLSVIAISYAYYIAFTSDKLSAIQVIYKFFFAVLLVILGTYLFYISFMTWYLKRRRKNKNYYYKPEHFVSTSQMIFRMKQNATGLASISLLAVMALVTIGTTVSLYANTQNMVNGLFLKNSRIEYYIPQNKEIQPEKYFQKDVLDKLHRSTKELITYRTAMIALNYNGDKKDIIINDNNIVNTSMSTGFVYIITQKDFKHLGNSIKTLKDNEVLFLTQKGNSSVSSFDFFGKKYKVKKLKHAIFPDLQITVNSAVLVLPSKADYQEIYRHYLPYVDKGLGISENYIANLDLSKTEISKITTANHTVGDEEFSGVLRTKSESLNLMYEFYGALLFTGFLLGISFLLGVALIVYYKQYSEGHEDKKSYHILQEVGMSQRQIKKTINSQIILFFFMPLGIATLHYLIAIPMLRQLLLTFGVTEAKLVYIVSFITIAIVAVLYFIIYRMTSKTYYKIIEH